LFAELPRIESLHENTFCTHENGVRSRTTSGTTEEPIPHVYTGTETGDR